MKLSRLATFCTAAALCVTPVMATEEDDQRQVVAMIIGMEGFVCGYASHVALSEDGNTFGVTCTENTDGSGVETHYWVTLTGSVQLVTE